MRAYFFGNMYLSSIQNGIQSAHVVGELVVKYRPTPQRIAVAQWKILIEWMDKHKTMVLLNAGYGEELHSLHKFFNETDNPYPWAPFHESKEALDGAFTSIGIVLPERIYNTSKVCREEGWNPFLLKSGALGRTRGLPTDLSTWEAELVNRLNQYGLAK